MLWYAKFKKVMTIQDNFWCTFGTRSVVVDTILKYVKNIEKHRRFDVYRSLNGEVLFINTVELSSAKEYLTSFASDEIERN